MISFAVSEVLIDLGLVSNGYRPVVLLVVGPSLFFCFGRVLTDFHTGFASIRRAWVHDR